jgi:hypothetical protein
LREGQVVVLHAEDVGVLEGQQVDHPQAMRFQRRVDVLQKGQLVLQHGRIDAGLRPVDVLQEPEDEALVVARQVDAGERAQRGNAAEVFLPLLVDEQALLLQMVGKPVQHVELSGTCRRLRAQRAGVELRNAECQRVDKAVDSLHGYERWKWLDMDRKL